MRRPILAVDQDDVLADLIPAWISRYNKDFGETRFVRVKNGDEVQRYLMAQIVAR